MSKNLSFTKLVLGAVLVLLSLTMFVPIMNLFAKAFSNPNKVHMLHGYDILPKGFSFINFQVVLSNPIVGKALMNSLFITIVGTCSAFSSQRLQLTY